MQVHCGEGVANHSAPSRAHAFARTRVKPRGAGRHRLLDDLLQLSPPAPGDEQPDADGGMARRHGQDRGGGEGCGYDASLGQRERVAHIPTAETEAARSGLILEGQGQARLHLKFNPSWSYEWGPVHIDDVKSNLFDGDVGTTRKNVLKGLAEFVGPQEVVLPASLRPEVAHFLVYCVRVAQRGRPAMDWWDPGQGRGALPKSQEGCWRLPPRH